MPDPRRCSKYTAPFLVETPNAPAPADRTTKAWVGFAVAQTGQLANANGDKAKASHVQKTCEDETQAAYDRAARRLKPWYKKIF